MRLPRLRPGRALRRALPLLALGASLICLPAGAATLREVYEHALRNDPQLREAEANRLATLESKPEAFAALLPQLTASGGYTHDENTAATPEIFSVGSSVTTAIGGVSSKTDTTNWQVQLRQTLFRWDQLATLRQADVKVAQAEIDYRAAQQDLVLRTAQRYFNVLAAKDALDAAEASREAISRQLDQANQRFEVGLIAITDVQEAKAAADTAAATVIAAKRALATAGDQLRELTGEAFNELTKPGAEMPLVSPDPVDEEQWVKTAIDQNLNLSSARLNADIAREGIAFARAGHYPTLDLVAGRSGSSISGTQVQSLTAAGMPPQSFPLTADANQSDKQIGLQITFPIYAGGGTSAKVREAVYRQRAARERLERTARETERMTRDAFLGVQSDISHVKALKQALESAETALKATDAGYEVGTRTAVDVLLSRQRLYQAQTDYLKSRYDYVVDVLTLEQAAGTLDESRLARVNGWLQESVKVQ
jgi:outer membrane protein